MAGLRSKVESQAKVISSLRRRMKTLEDEVQECRRLNRRIAELTDVVGELLVPAMDRDDAAVRQALQRYRESL